MVCSLLTQTFVAPVLDTLGRALRCLAFFFSFLSIWCGRQTLGPCPRVSSCNSYVCVFVCYMHMHKKPLTLQKDWVPRCQDSAFAPTLGIDQDFCLWCQRPCIPLVALLHLDCQCLALAGCFTCHIMIGGSQLVIGQPERYLLSALLHPSAARSVFPLLFKPLPLLLYTPFPLPPLCLLYLQTFSSPPTLLQQLLEHSSHPTKVLELPPLFDILLLSGMCSSLVPFHIFLWLLFVVCECLVCVVCARLQFRVFSFSQAWFEGFPPCIL